MPPKASDDKTQESAANQAKAQLENVQEMIKVLKEATSDNPDHFSFFEGEKVTEEKMREIILRDALEVSVRHGWKRRDTVDTTEYSLLLCWGGPAVRVRGGTDKYGFPDNVVLEYQDWFTPWTEYKITEKEKEDLLEYVKQFEFEYIV